MHKIYTGDVNLTNNTYENCSTITQVDLMQTPWVNNSMTNAFSGCSNLQSITNINNDVNDITDAFYNCSKLTTVSTLPTSLKVMTNAFKGCSNLSTIPTLPSGLITATHAFYGCSSITTVPTIPNSVLDLNYTFSDCTNLTTVPSLAAIHFRYAHITGTFRNCVKLTTHPILNDSLLYSDYTFLGCSNLTTANIPSNALRLLETYYGCSSLTTLPNLPVTLTNINHAFGACVNITGDINILSDKIDDATDVFGETSLRKNVYIPPVQYNDTSVNSPTYNAFIAAGYDELGTKDGVYLMYNYSPVESSDWITSTAANNTIVLERYIGSNTSVITPHNDWYSNKILNTSYTQAYPNVTGPYINNREIQNVDLANVEVINNNFAGTFAWANNLQTVTNLNQNVTNMASSFSGCENLSTFPAIPPNVINLSSTFQLCKQFTIPPTIPASVTDMSYAFQSCINLTEVPIIPDSVTNIGSICGWCHSIVNANLTANSAVTAFNCLVHSARLENANITLPNATTIFSITADCPNLTDVNIIAPNATNITNAFNNCPNLTNVHVEFNSVTSVINLFRDSSSVKNIDLTATNATSAMFLCMNCSELETISLNVPNCTTWRSAFYGCTKLSSIPSIPASVTNLMYAFEACRTITTLPTLPPTLSATGLEHAFAKCNNLTAAPSTLPSGITSLYYTFGECSRLASAPSTIPDSVVNMCAAFLSCHLLTSVPEIPANVTNLHQTYYADYGLTSVPNVPEKVTDMGYTYALCNNLTGNIYIKSSNVINAYRCFWNTAGSPDALIKNVYIHFEYENGVATPTYNSFINAGYGTNDYLDGVHLKDIDGSKITINATPSDAIVQMRDLTDGTEISLDDWSYIGSGKAAEIQGYNGSDTAIVVPSLFQTRNSMRALEGHVIEYIVSKEGYETVTGTHTVNGTETINVNLEQIMCTITINPIPQDATVTLTTNATLYCWYSGDLGYYLYTLSENINVGDTLYYLSLTPAGTITTITSATTFSALVHGISEDFGRQSSMDSDYLQSGNSITVPWGTEVSYTVSKAHYQTATGTHVAKVSGSIGVQLARDQHTFTITPTPNDAAVQILVNGRLVNATNSDWTFTANNVNGDIELQTYTGSNTVVTMPTSFTTANSIIASYGDTIEWKVSKAGYTNKTGTLTLDQDTTLNVNLGDAVNIEDYNYTLNTGTLTLTEYIGSGGNIEVPLIEDGV